MVFSRWLWYSNDGVLHGVFFLFSRHSRTLQAEPRPLALHYTQVTLRVALPRWVRVTLPELHASDPSGGLATKLRGVHAHVWILRHAKGMMHILICYAGTDWLRLYIGDTSWWIGDDSVFALVWNYLFELLMMMIDLVWFLQLPSMMKGEMPMASEAGETSNCEVVLCWIKPRYGTWVVELPTCWEVSVCTCCYEEPCG